MLYITEVKAGCSLEKDLGHTGLGLALGQETVGFL